VRADLDTLLIAVYCAACSFFPAPEPKPRRGRPQRITDNELLCLMVAQMLLGQPSDRRFLAGARRRLGHLFPVLPSQSRYNERCRQLAPKLVTLWRAIASDLPGFHDALSYVDTTPLPCGQSVQTTTRSELAPWCGFGYSAAHSRFYWGMRLVLWCGPDGCVRDFDLVPANAGEREAVLELLARQPPVGQLVIADKGFAGADFEQLVKTLGARLLRPDRKNEPRRHGSLGPIRQWIESIIDTLKGQLSLEDHGAHTMHGIAVRIAQRLLALAACLWHNWQINQPGRHLTPYDH
jgi:hypothetical protein